jgi:hypothetical protein
VIGHLSCCIVIVFVRKAPLLYKCEAGCIVNGYDHFILTKEDRPRFEEFGTSGMKGWWTEPLVEPLVDWP